MKKENPYQVCPLCGSARKQRTRAYRTDAGDGRSALHKPLTALADSFVAESSDDKTANAFASLLLKDRTKDGFEGQ